MKNGKKITLATVKAFIKANRENLFINVKRQFDGMVDGEVSKNLGYLPAEETTEHLENTLGIRGAWFVGSSRDGFQAIEEDGFEGIKVFNACGAFILAIKATEAAVPSAEEQNDDWMDEVEVKVGMVIQSHLNDAAIVAFNTPEAAADHIRFAQYLIHRFPDTNTRINADKIFIEYNEQPKQA